MELVLLKDLPEANFCIIDEVVRRFAKKRRLSPRIFPAQFDDPASWIAGKFCIDVVHIQRIRWYNDKKLVMNTQIVHVTYVDVIMLDTVEIPTYDDGGIHLGATGQQVMTPRTLRQALLDLVDLRRRDRRPVLVNTSPL